MAEKFKKQAGEKTDTQKKTTSNASIETSKYILLSTPKKTCGIKITLETNKLMK